MARHRSPQYPSLNLRDAVERVNMIFQKEGQVGMSREIAAQHIGYKGLSGASLPVISTLRKYGLLEGRGDETRVSDDAVTIIADRDADDQSERHDALWRAFLNDDLFETLYGRFGVKSSELNIIAYLTKSGFAPSAAKKAAVAYIESIAFVNEEAGDYNPKQELGSEPEKQVVETSFINNKNKELNQNISQSKSNMQQDTFSLEEGQVILQWPKHLSPSSYADLEDWLQLVLRRAKRSVKSSGPQDEESNGE